MCTSRAERVLLLEDTYNKNEKKTAKVYSGFIPPKGTSLSNDHHYLIHDPMMLEHELLLVTAAPKELGEEVVPLTVEM